MEGQAKKAREATVCRIIGAGKNAPEAANHAAAEVIKNEQCKVVDWDGDPIGPRAEADGGRTFASALRDPIFEEGPKPALSPHCVPADCGPNEWADAEKAEQDRAAGSKYYAPGVQMVPEEELLKATDTIRQQLGDNALPEPPADKNFPKYLALAVADRLMQPPDLVIWQMDDARAPDTYWNWVSLGEYQAMKTLQPNTRYILINNEGKQVMEAGQPWESYHHFGTEPPAEMDEPVEPIMPMSREPELEPEKPFSH